MSIATPSRDTNITTGVVNPALANRSISFGGFDLSMTNMDDLTLTSSTSSTVVAPALTVRNTTGNPALPGRVRILESSTGGGTFYAGLNAAANLTGNIDVELFAAIPAPTVTEMVTITNTGGVGVLASQAIPGGGGAFDPYSEVTFSAPAIALLTVGDFGKPIAQDGGILNDTTTNELPAGLLMSIENSTTVKLAQVGDEVTISTALLLGGDSYSLTGNRMAYWDFSLELYVDEPPWVDVFPFPQKVIFINKVGVGTFTATVLG